VNQSAAMRSVLQELSSKSWNCDGNPRNKSAASQTDDLKWNSALNNLQGADSSPALAPLEFGSGEPSGRSGWGRCVPAWGKGRSFKNPPSMMDTLTGWRGSHGFFMLRRRRGDTASLRGEGHPCQTASKPHPGTCRASAETRDVD
jgi:hypothetical protein